MNRLLMFVGMTLGGYVGWWAGDYVGFGIMGTFLVSSLGSIAGVYLAWRIIERLLGLREPMNIHLRPLITLLFLEPGDANHISRQNVHDGIGVG